MKFKIIIAPKFINTFAGKMVSAMALFPFILVKDKALKNSSVLINHEKIHLIQQLELLILPFYIWYSLEYLIKLIKYRNHRKAYLAISFEREAYAKECDLDYLKKRRIWSFLKYL